MKSNYKVIKPLRWLRTLKILDEEGKKYHKTGIFRNTQKKKRISSTFPIFILFICLYPLIYLHSTLRPQEEEEHGSLESHFFIFLRGNNFKINSILSSNLIKIQDRV